MFEYTATYKRNYDGDTCTLAIDLGFGIFICHSVRLIGIDTAELKTGDNKELAKRSRDWLRDKLINRELTITTFRKVAKTGEKDKYGRILADIFVKGESMSVSDQMIAAGLAIPYDGGKKQPELFAAVEDGVSPVGAAPP